MKKWVFISVIIFCIFLSRNFYAQEYSQENKVKVYGKLVDKDNVSVNATISVDSFSNTTDANGNYYLSVSQGIYDLKYDLTSFFIPNFYIKLPHLSINSDMKDAIDVIVGDSTQNKLSFSVDTGYSQIVQIYSPNKPKRVLINGTNATEVSSLSQLNDYTWLHNSSENKLYIDTAYIQSTCSDGTVYGQCSSTKPHYCDNGILINFCGAPYNCGCSNGYICQMIGTCLNNSGLIGYWKFDEGSDLIVSDSSGNENDGSIVGASWANGKIDKALSFDGVNDYVRIPDSNVFNITDEMTVSAWIYPLTSQSTGGSNQIVQRLDWGNKRGFFLREGYNQSHSPTFYVGNGSYWFNVYSSNIASNMWHHVVGTVKANDKIKIYVDGNLKSQNNFIGKIVQNVGDIKIGYEASGKAFNGTIDDVKIWSRVITDGEIKREYGTQNCSDGTMFGQCSLIKPQYCDDGSLINNCSQCGCPTNLNCNTTDEQCYASFEGVDFISISDTHIGRSASSGSGADNLTSFQRYQKIFNVTNGINTRFIINQGDLTDGWWSNDTKQQTRYQNYTQLSLTSKNQVLQVRGNHDANKSLYESMIGQLNWENRYDDILVAGIGLVAEDANQWQQSNVTYDQATTDFLDSVVSSQDYSQTNYHFLFEHLVPYGSYDMGQVFNRATENVSEYYKYFDMIFYGHFGGKENVSLLNNEIPIIKASHLGDGKVATDTFLTIMINRTNGIITIISNNFYNGTAYVLFSEKSRKT